MNNLIENWMIELIKIIIGHCKYCVKGDNMNIRDKLYKRDNKTIPKSINIDDSTYYAKLKAESVIHRNLMLRKSNIKKFNEYHQKTGNSFTRLVNGAIKEFFE